MAHKGRCATSVCVPSLIPTLQSDALAKSQKRRRAARNRRTVPQVILRSDIVPEVNTYVNRFWSVHSPRRSHKPHVPGFRIREGRPARQFALLPRTHTIAVARSSQWGYGCE